MKQQLQAKRTLRQVAATLALAALVLFAPTAWGQNLADYTFATGVDANRWITLSDNATQIVATGQDDAVSSLTNIGFTFSFGEGDYTQFWANSNGIFSMGSSPSGSYPTQFTSGNHSANQPKICGITRDLSTGMGGYVKYELTGTAPNRVLVCEYYLYISASTGNPAAIKWQVQLYEANSKVALVYGPATSTPSGFQIGLSESSSDIWTVNPTTHEATHATGSVSTTYSTWPGENRYYEFNRPVYPCERPASLAVSNITTTGVTLNLTGGSGLFNVQTKAGGGNWTYYDYEIEDYTIALTGLTPGTAYEVRVQSVCTDMTDPETGDAETSLWRTASFYTLCDAVTTFPWSETFESYAAGNFSHPCWVNEHITGNGTQIFKVYTNTNATNSTHQLQLPDMTSGTQTLLRLPVMTLPTTSGWLFSIDVYRNTSGTSSTMEGVRVFASTNGEIEGATELGFLHRNCNMSDGGEVIDEGSTGWYNYEFLIPFTGTCFIILRGESTYGSATYMDNLEVKAAPACLKPSHLQATATTTTSATLGWTAGAATQTAGEIAYSTTSFNPGDPDCDWTDITVVPVTSNPATITGLTHSTVYYAHVRAGCGTDGYSSWSRANYSFATACLPVDNLPWGEDFSGITGTTGIAHILPVCWQSVNTTTFGETQGYPTVYAYEGNTTPNCLRFYSFAYYSSGGTTTYDPQPQYAILPAISGLGGRQIKLRAKAYSSGSTFKVGTMSDPTDVTTFTEIATQGFTSSDYYNYQAYDFFVPTTTTDSYIAIMIEAATQERSTNGVYIDEIEVLPCPVPTNFTAGVPTPNTVQLSWTENGTATAWQLCVGGDETNLIDVTTNPYTLTGLTPSTDYTVKLRANCGTDDGNSLWTPTVAIHTADACPAPAFAAGQGVTDVAAHQATVAWTSFTENNSYTVSYRTASYLDGVAEEFGIYSPSGWENKQGLFDETHGTVSFTSTSSGWSFGSNNGVFDNHARCNLYSSNKRWLITPAISVGTGFAVDFDLALTAYSGILQAAQTNGTDDKFMVLVTTDDEATWTVLRKWDNAGSAYVLNNIATAGENVTIDLSSYAGQTVRIAFYGESTTSNADNNLHIDNVEIGFLVPAGEWTNITGATSPTTLPNLNAETLYDVKVTSYCTGDVENESATLQFTTLCPAPALAASGFTNILPHEATVAWTGNTENNSYTLSYRTAAYVDGEVEDFHNSPISRGWENKEGMLTGIMAGTASLTSGSYWSFGTGNNVFGSSHTRMNIYSTCAGWLITPAISLGTGDALNFDLALTRYGSNGAAQTSGTDDRFIVLVSTDNEATWTILREWNNTGSADVYNTIATAGENVTIDLSSYAGQTVRIAFYGESTEYNADNNLHIDNVAIGTLVPATAWTDVPSATNPYTITGLDPETVYDVKVTGHCTVTDGESATLQFTSGIACQVPTGLTRTNVQSHQMDLSWTENGTATDWVLAYKTDAQGTFTEIPVTTNPYTLTGLDALTNYTVKVRTDCGTEGYSRWSDPIVVTTDTACHTPTHFTTGVPTPNTVELSWTETGTATAWQLCVNGDETNLIDVTTNPYTLTGLTPSTDYTVKVRANCGTDDGTSLWSGTRAFRSADACPAPVFAAGQGVTAVAAHEATVAWTTFTENNDYTVSYRTASYLNGVDEQFATSSTPAGWEGKSGLFDEGTGTATLTNNSGWSFYEENGVFDGHAYVNIYSSGCRYWLITPTIDVEAGFALAFDMAYTAYGGTLQPADATGTDDKFMVLITTDDEATWTVLRKWDNAGSAYVLNNIATAGQHEVFDLSSYAGQTVRIAFYGESTEYNADNNLHIDNVGCGAVVPAGAWTNITGATSPATIPNLDAETIYDVRVLSYCSGNEENVSDTLQFTTTIACPAPTSLQYSNVATHQVDLSWTPGNVETAWQICVNGDEENLIDVTTSTYTLTGLTAETAYTIKVRANCGMYGTFDDGVSAWSNTVNVTTTIACPVPTNLTCVTTALEGYNPPDAIATLSWTKHDESSWLLCIDGDEANAITLTSADVDAITGNTVTYTLTGLRHSTLYTAKVRAVCGIVGGYDDGMSVWSGTINITTPCSSISDYPIWKEDFESYANNTLPPCWSVINRNSSPSSYRPIVSDQASHSGCRGIRMWTYNGDEYLILPEVQNIGGKRLKFFAKARWWMTPSGGNHEATFRVGVISDPTDYTTFTQVGNPVSMTNSTEYTEYTFTFNLYSGTGNRMCIKINNPSRAYGGIDIDDVTIEEVPSFDDITDLTQDSASLTTVSISWNRHHNEHEWQICIDDDEDNAFWVDNTTVTLVGNHVSYTITGLTPASRHNVRVRGFQAAQLRTYSSQYSYWTHNIEVRTLCDPYTVTYANPYSEGFEDYPCGKYQQRGVMPVRWDSYGTTNGQYYIIPPHVIGSGSYCYVHEGSRTLSLYGYYVSGGGNSNSYAALPVFTNDLNDLQIDFWMQVQDASYGMLTLGYITAGDVNYNTFVPIDTFANTGAMAHRYADITVPSTATRLVFCWNSQYEYSCCIDDVVVSKKCATVSSLAASGITATAATLGWISNSPAHTGWQVAYSTDATFDPDDVSPVDVTANPCTLTGLTPATTYYAYVRAICESVAYSPWSSEYVTFTTLCETPTVLAVTEGSVTPHSAEISWTGTSDSYVIMVGEEYRPVDVDFESGTMPIGFTTTTPSYPWTVVANSHSGAYCARSGNYHVSSSESDMVLEVTLAQDATLTFSAKISSESGYDRGYFYIDGTVQTDINGFSGGGSWINYSFPLAAGTHTFRWRYTKDSSVNSNDDCFYVDDIRISAAPTSWDETRTAPSSPYTLTGLDAETSYQVKVKGVCTTGDSDPSDPVSFTTGIACFAPTALIVSNVTTAGATLGWTENGTATAWQLCVNGDETNLIDVTTNPYTLTGLTDGTTYTVKVRANCGTEGFSTLWSNEESFTTPFLCPAPTDVAVTDGSVTAQGAEISWTGTSDSYIIMVGEEYRPVDADFEDGTLPTVFTTTTSYPWTVVANSHSGAYCARSTNNGQSNSSSNMILEVTLASEGILTFSAQISSESGWDKGFFYIDDVVQSNINGISGSGSWIDYSYPLATGTHTLKWSYSKDNSGDVSSDCFFVDDIRIVADPTTWDETRTAPSSPYTLTGLNPETNYRVRVKGVCTAVSRVSLPSDFVVFTTACPAPVLEASDITNIGTNQATVAWTGNTENNNYTLSYRTAAYFNGEVEDFHNNPITGGRGWEMRKAPLSDIMAGTATIPTATTVNCKWRFGNYNHVFHSYHAYMNICCTGNNDWLISPSISVGTDYVLNFRLALTVEDSDSERDPSGTDDRFIVLVSTDNEATWTILREWNNSGSAYVYNNIATAGENVTIDLSSYAGQTVHIAFYGESTSFNGDNDMHLDDVAVGTDVPATAWVDIDNPTNPYTITGLDPETLYDVKVTGHCSVSDGESATVQFTTQRVFTMDIVAEKWYALSSPVNDGTANQDFDNVLNLLPASDEFGADLFLYNEATSTWENYKAGHSYFTALERGHGYIYRRSADATLYFYGMPNSGSLTRTPAPTANSTNIDLKGFNLVGNPYMHPIYKSVAFTDDGFATGWYALTPNGIWAPRLDNEPIAIGQAALVQALSGSSYPSPFFTDDASAPVSAKEAPATTLLFTVTGHGLQDMAYAMLGNGNSLSKMNHFNEAAPVLSIPVESRRYAIANLGRDCETFDMAFRGIEGEYTLTLTANPSTLDYCHLIDRATGKDIDLLQTPTYTFTHSSIHTFTDRFQVKLTPNVEENTMGNFAYWNGSAWVVEGTGTLEVYDVVGRLVFTGNVNSQLSILNSQFPTMGVYVLRLGEKNQKIVVK